MAMLDARFAPALERSISCSLWDRFSNFADSTEEPMRSASSPWHNQVRGLANKARMAGRSFSKGYCSSSLFVASPPSPAAHSLGKGGDLGGVRSSSMLGVSPPRASSCGRLAQLPLSPLPTRGICQKLPSLLSGLKDAPKKVSSTRRDKAKAEDRRRLGFNFKLQKELPQKKFMRRLQENQKVDDYYDLAQDMLYDCGDRGSVHKATKRSSKEEVALKVRRKRTVDLDAIWRKTMLKIYNVKSRFILPIKEILEDDLNFYIVMPLCDGGELFDYLDTASEISAAECKRLISEILVAVEHLHDNNIIHQDIKPENIMFDLEGEPDDRPGTVKLIDFDTCVEWEMNAPSRSTFVGTAGYIAPEVLLGKPCPQSDLWSVGVILYVMLTGETPFPAKTVEDCRVDGHHAKQMFAELEGAVVDYDMEVFRLFPLVRDLCESLLSFKVEERMVSAGAALAHPWLAPNSSK